MTTSVNRHVPESAGARLGEQAKRTVHDLQEMGGIAKDMAQEKLEELQESAYEYVEDGQERVEALSKSLKKTIRAKPLKAIMIAAGIGFVFGRCMRR